MILNLQTAKSDPQDRDAVSTTLQTANADLQNTFADLKPLLRMFRAYKPHLETYNAALRNFQPEIPVWEHSDPVGCGGVRQFCPELGKPNGDQSLLPPFGSFLVGKLPLADLK